MSDVSRFGSYILPGRAPSPLDGITQAIAGEQLGLGSIWASERWESKETGGMIGALSQATSRVGLVAGLTHFGTRHPLVLAGMASTLQQLSRGRFTIGFGRSVPTMFRQLGIPVIGNAGMAEYTGILRRLWAGETVSYDGPLGVYPKMQMPVIPETPPAMILGAVGPKTLALAGTHFDGVVLHPFLTVEAVAKSAKIVRDAAESVGRDPASLKITATVVTAPDTLCRAERLSALEARAISYFIYPELGLPIVRINGWDESVIEQFATDSALHNLEFGNKDNDYVRQQFAEAAGRLPAHWLSTGAASGSPRECAEQLQAFLDAGADEILLHGTTPERQGELVAAIRDLG